MYSLMSSWISESSSPNRNSASVLDSSVLPTPDGPAKMNDPPARLGDLLVVLAQVRRRGHAADPHPGAGLVDQVDGLVRQEAVADVAVGQLGRCDQRAVRDGHTVVGFVPVAQALEDLDGVRDRRPGSLGGLEPALERGVLFQGPAVLIQP